jgi:UDP-N-acetyl-D-glucosamine dehydrogenase
MPDYVVRRLTVALNRRAKAVNGSRVLLLGLSYKKGTGDSRVSPSHSIAQQLRSLGADLRACDPHVLDIHAPPELRRVVASAGEIAAADAVILLVDHDEFDYWTIAKEAKYVLDCRHHLPNGPNVEYL